MSAVEHGSDTLQRSGRDARGRSRQMLRVALAFENFYPFPAVQRAYEEASFEIQGATPKRGN